MVSIKKLAHSNAECRIRNADLRHLKRRDSPGETFYILEEKEVNQYGEYRTRRLVRSLG